MSATRTAEIAALIEQGQAMAGIEMGSTRIKAVLIGLDHAPLASGGFGWENTLANGVWTYSLDEVWAGLQANFIRAHLFSALCALRAAYMVREQRGQTLPDFLKQVFGGNMGEAVPPDPADADGFERYYQRYRKGLEIDRAAVATLP